jgi:hypothetical protein
MAAINSQNQIGHAILESVFATAGAPSNSNAFKIISLVTDPAQDLIDRPDKNPALGATIGIGGLKRGTWSMRCSLAGSAAAGTAPDIGPLLQAAMGAVPVVVASTSVTYGMGSNNYSLTLWNFWNPTDATQYVSIGSVVNSLSIDCSGTQPIIEMSGTSYWVLDTDQFADAETAAKGGLASFPAVPSAPVTNGSMLSLFAGSAVLDGNSYGDIRSFRLNANFNREIPQDTIFSGQYGSAPASGRRDITFDLNIYDKSGDVNFSALKNKAIKKTPIAVTATIGAVAGSRLVIPMPNVLLGTPSTDDGGTKKAINFSGSKAYMTTSTANNEFSLSYT